MKHPAKPGTHKVVTRKGMFFIAPVADETLPEAYASANERATLATRVGYVNGTYPGLVEEFARHLRARLEGSRKGRRRR
jgi:hypothetical protein